MQVSVLLVLVGVLGMVPESLKKLLEELDLQGNRLEYSEESCRYEETCSHSDPSEKPPVKTEVRNSRRVK